MPWKSNKKDKQKPQQEDKHSEGEEMSDAMSLMEEDVEDEDAGETSSSGEKTNEDIMKAIISLKSGLYKKIDVVEWTISDVKKQVQECTGRIAHAKQRISGAEDNVNELLTKVSTLENTVKTLTNKVDDLECRSRCNNVRLVGLPEKAEGQDATAFLERWLPGVLGLEPWEAPVIEQAHRIGTLPPNSSTGHPRTLIMKFLNFRDRERVLKAAQIKGKILYNNEQVCFHPDLSAGVHKMQRSYDEVQKKLRDKGINKHRIIFPARLLVTHDDRSHLFQTPAEADNFLQSLRN